MEDFETILYSVEDAARVVGISRTKMFAEIREGRIIARKHGRRTLIARTELERFAQSLPRAAVGN